MIEAELADGRILEFPDGTDPAVIQATVKRMVGAAGDQAGGEDSRSISDIGRGVAELAASVGTELVAEPVAGLVGIGEALNPLSDEGAAAARVAATKDAIQFQPGEQGAALAKDIGGAVEAVDHAALEHGDRFLREGGGPVDTMTGGLALLLRALGGAARDIKESPDAVAQMFGPAAGAAASALPSAVGLVTGARGGRALGRVDDLADTVAGSERARRATNAARSERIASGKVVDEGDTRNLTQVLKEEPANAEAAGYMLVGDKVVADELARKAIHQGFSPGAVASAKSANPVDRQKMRRMLAIERAARSNKEIGISNRASDVLGESVAQRVKVVLSANREAGKRLDSVAKSLRGEPVDFSPAVSSFLRDLDRLGVSVNVKNGIKLDFQGADIEGVKGAEKILSNVVKRMTSGKPGEIPSAYDVHRLKKFIDEQVNFGKNKKGLSGKAEAILKNLRRNMDQVLDQNFPEYDRVNTQFSETRAVLDDLQSIAGSKVDLDGENAAKHLGTLARRISSNAQSRIPLLEAVEGIEGVARKYSDKITDNLKPQIVFVNELERRFGSSAPTSLKGQMDSTAGKAVDAAASVMTQGAGQTATGLALEAAKAAANKARGINDDAAFRTINSLLMR